jgi:hypothetical protein
MVIIQRKTYEVDLFEAGFAPGAVMIVHRERGFNDRTVFDSWAEKVLFPEIERRRAAHSYTGAAVVILDTCTCHDSD